MVNLFVVYCITTEGKRMVNVYHLKKNTHTLRMSDIQYWDRGLVMFGVTPILNIHTAQAQANTVAFANISLVVLCIEFY